MNGTAPKERELSKRGKKPSTYRRLVTENVNGKSVVQSDEHMQAYEFKTVPGYEHTLIWVNPTTPDLSKQQRFDCYPDTVVPGPGGTSLHFVTFPPGSVFADQSFDAGGAQEEALIRLRGLADHFEKEDPGMHKTNTVDAWRCGCAKRDAARVAEQRHKACHDALFPERRCCMNFQGDAAVGTASRLLNLTAAQCNRVPIRGINQSAFSVQKYLRR
jgi:hypothetical protein